MATGRSHESLCTRSGTRGLQIPRVPGVLGCRIRGPASSSRLILAPQEPGHPPGTHSTGCTWACGCVTSRVGTESTFTPRMPTLLLPPAAPSSPLQTQGTGTPSPQPGPDRPCSPGTKGRELGRLGTQQSLCDCWTPAGPLGRGVRTAVLCQVSCAGLSVSSPLGFRGTKQHLQVTDCGSCRHWLEAL